MDLSCGAFDIIQQSAYNHFKGFSPVSGTDGGYKMYRRPIVLIVFLLLFSAMLGTASAEKEEPHYTLPIDFSPGMPINQKYYVSDTVYEDPTIKVTITTGDERGVLYWIADVEIQDASQLRTLAAEDFDSNGTEYGSVLARRVNAVLAIDGDFYCYVRSGTTVTIRQGIAYQDHWDRAKQDVLVVDEDGDFHGIAEPQTLQGCTEINGKKIINAFCFGPLLVNNGTISTRPAPYWVPEDQYSQRVAIAQTGHLKYRVIVTGPSKRGSRAFTFDPWRRFVAGMEDILVAYNLDGGDSAVMVFNGEKINDPLNENERPLADMIYFASAWPGE